MAMGIRGARTKDSLTGTCLGGRYQILRCLGRGSMGAVYEAEQLPIRRRCAVKVLLEQLEQNDVLRHRFQREARAVSLLNHPNLVTLYDFGIEDTGQPYLVMEFLEGEPLSALIPFHTLTLRDVCSIIEQITLAFAEVHQHGIIHRDLKPENIFLLSGVPPHRYQTKVLDFGLAKLLEADDQIMLTATGEIYGTPLYMSPEQGTGSSTVTAATDIYALGVMLYELLTGHPPFGGRTPIAILTQHARRPVPPIRPRRDIEVSAPLADVVYRCLEKKPQQRFQNAQEFLSALAATPEGQRYFQHTQRRSSLLPSVPLKPPADASLMSEPHLIAAAEHTTPPITRAGAPLSALASAGITSGVLNTVDEDAESSSPNLSLSSTNISLPPLVPLSVSAPSLNFAPTIETPAFEFQEVPPSDSALHVHPTAWVTLKAPGCLTRLSLINTDDWGE